MNILSITSLNKKHIFKELHREGARAAKSKRVRPRTHLPARIPMQYAIRSHYLMPARCRLRVSSRPAWIFTQRDSQNCQKSPKWPLFMMLREKN